MRILEKVTEKDNLQEVYELCQEIVELQRKLEQIYEAKIEVPPSLQ